MAEKRRHAAGKGSIAEFRSAFAEIAADLKPISAKLAAEVADSIAENATRRSESQYQGENPFGLEAKRVEGHKQGDGYGIYADWYWFFGEFGTSRQPARPYLVPALTEEYAKVYPKARVAFEALRGIRKA